MSKDKDTLYPIEITKEQKDWLKEQAAKEDRSMAWVIRKLIDEARKGEDKA